MFEQKSRKINNFLKARLLRSGAGLGMFACPNPYSPRDSGARLRAPDCGRHSTRSGHRRTVAGGIRCQDHISVDVRVRPQLDGAGEGDLHTAGQGDAALEDRTGRVEDRGHGAAGRVTDRHGRLGGGVGGAGDDAAGGVPQVDDRGAIIQSRGHVTVCDVGRT